MHTHYTLTTHPSPEPHLGYDIPRGHRPAPNRPESSEEESSEDSMNPYDEY